MGTHLVLGDGNKASIVVLASVTDIEFEVQSSHGYVFICTPSRKTLVAWFDDIAISKEDYVKLLELNKLADSVSYASVDSFHVVLDTIKSHLGLPVEK